ncbi:hypothetical protein DPMN_004572 [Dreissena polymorpha]|uniref:Uncharacterized protein n=1 Tax=Dreissena polymorpha TaxID=45954 RepID=A0A9D4RT41_DREPO|nr:hypothetical protein DPMN_004572 [Dreissena polymorpha]
MWENLALSLTKKARFVERSTGIRDAQEEKDTSSINGTTTCRSSARFPGLYQLLSRSLHPPRSGLGPCTGCFPGPLAVKVSPVAAVQVPTPYLQQLRSRSLQQLRSKYSTRSVEKFCGDQESSGGKALALVADGPGLKSGAVLVSRSRLKSQKSQVQIPHIPGFKSKIVLGSSCGQIWVQVPESPGFKSQKVPGSSAVKSLVLVQDSPGFKSQGSSPAKSQVKVPESPGFKFQVQVQEIPGSSPVQSWIQVLDNSGFRSSTVLGSSPTQS